MEVLKFLANNWDSILIVVALIATIIILVVKKQYAILAEMIFSLVTEAERQFGGGTGTLKKATVVKWVYEKLPDFIKPLFSEKIISDMIEKALESAKLKWESNASLKAYIESE